MFRVKFRKITARDNTQAGEGAAKVPAPQNIPFFPLIISMVGSGLLFQRDSDQTSSTIFISSSYTVNYIAFPIRLDLRLKKPFSVLFNF